MPLATISAAPLGTVENNGTATATLQVSETAGVEVPSKAFNESNITISVSLQYIELKDFNVSLVTGSVLDYFTASYNTASNILLFRQKSNIPANWTGIAEFPINVTKNSTEAQSFNGFNANISALALKTKAVGSAAVFTYTDANVSID
ncbi:hypothetical protein ULMS_17100 [Patiriisocius marinistellae]|uniref:Uncharacterized protein n=2 Tax=Patiriisocius marinistellae TaxID=2494560 RepID=A0A5J4FYA7_9FLAO|nr:hypothetical protein ULMS_17100 [Patiriisocius marinistellae]